MSLFLYLRRVHLVELLLTHECTCFLKLQRLVHLAQIRYLREVGEVPLQQRRQHPCYKSSWRVYRSTHEDRSLFRIVELVSL